jgi:ABC-type branched-subunit amino acid transport system substrate-binding protein
MIRPTRAWQSAAVLAAAALALSACGSNNNAQTQTKPKATNSATQSASSGGGTTKGDGTLTIGTLLPQTGDLAFLGPPEFAGVQAAVDDINAAGSR